MKRAGTIRGLCRRFNAAVVGRATAYADPGGRQEPWPPAIVETDPPRLYERMIEQWTATALHRLLLESAAAEHAARYGLMEVVTQNANRLVVELALAIQTVRQQTITREMQELAVGTGLLR